MIVVACLVSVLGLALALPSGDGIAASENFVVMAQEVVAGGGHATSANFQVDQSVGGLTAGYVAESESFKVIGGVVSITDGLVEGQPIIIGVSPPSGTGVTPAQLVGFNFESMLQGAGNPLVFFGNQPAGVDTGNASNTIVPITTPDGADGAGAPGTVDVLVAIPGLLGFQYDILEGGFTFLSALNLVERPGDHPERLLRVTSNVVGYATSLVVGTEASSHPEALGARADLKVGGDLVTLPWVRTTTDVALLTLELPPELVPPGTRLHVQAVIRPLDPGARLQLTNPLLLEW